MAVFAEESARLVNESTGLGLLVEAARMDFNDATHAPQQTSPWHSPLGAAHVASSFEGGVLRGLMRNAGAGVPSPQHGPAELGGGGLTPQREAAVLG